MPNRTIHEKLVALSRNLWWAWTPEVLSIFRDLNPTLFQQVDNNPVALLASLSPDVIEARTVDTTFHARVDSALRQLERYLQGTDTWSAVHAGPLRTRPVAYFSAEFGLHESLPIYSGGLGVLAGDHLKSASDLGVPIVAVGLFYREGYFRQRLDPSGWQQAIYQVNDPVKLAVDPVLDAEGKPLVVGLRTREGILHGRVWKVAVGRCTLVLLDSDTPENSPEDRTLTARLYGGDSRTRIRQELLLGVGGVRALHLMGIHPGVFHLNEGHSAFAGLEATRVRMEMDGVRFEEAMREVAYRTVFTTHTPVEAGHDRFSAQQLETTLGPLRESLGLSEYELMALGRVNPQDNHEPFTMTVLALKLSRFANGVSALHGRVTRKMWHRLYPSVQEHQVPIGHITNGVHVLTWLAPEMHQLYDRHFTPEWPRRQCDPHVWAKIDSVEDAELWETHRLLKVKLVSFVRDWLARQRTRRGASSELVARSYGLLEPEILTIGFARRFATYKRADLLFGDLDRLDALVNNKERPIQFVFAGKAHPNDEGGKALIQRIVQLATQERFASRIVFLEDYDMNVARHLVQGVDVWLNNPRRPLEASGTSGQKVLLNGILNASILDGWWPEAYDGLNGWAIGEGWNHSNHDIQDKRDRDALFSLLSEQIAPLYYDRGRDGIPHHWVARMKRTIKTLGWRFNTDRMVMDYASHGYLPANGAATSDPRR